MFSRRRSIRPTTTGKFFFHIFGAVAQFERDMISERTKAGIEAARKRGRRGGRRPKLNEGKAKQALQLLADNPALTQEDVGRMMGVSRATLNRAWERHGLVVDPTPSLPRLAPPEDV